MTKKLIKYVKIAKTEDGEDAMQFLGAVYESALKPKPALKKQRSFIIKQGKKGSFHDLKTAVTIE